jgi:hypothetical protein
MFWGLGFENLHCDVTGESGVVDARNECTESRVVIECAQFLCYVNEFLDLFRARSGFVVTQNKGYDPRRNTNLNIIVASYSDDNSPISKVI